MKIEAGVSRQHITLAERLASGPLNLACALLYAADITNALRGLHETGRAHGSVHTASVMVGDDGATLLPRNGDARSAAAASDVSAFGALLYEMLTGGKPPAGLAPAPWFVPRLTSEEGIRAAAVHLASRCLGSVSDLPMETRKVLTEIRLLGVRAKINKRAGSPAPDNEGSRRPPGAFLEESPVTILATSAPARKSASQGQAAVPPVPGSGFLAVGEPENPEPAMSGVKCPSCGLSYVYPSQPKHWFENLLAAWNFSPMRCHRCMHRYIASLGKTNALGKGLAKSAGPLSLAPPKGASKRTSIRRRRKPKKL